MMEEWSRRLTGGSLLLHIETSQLRWFGHLVRMLPGHLPDDEGMPNWEKTMRQTQDMLERLHLSWPGSTLV